MKRKKAKEKMKKFKGSCPSLGAQKTEAKKLEKSLA